jgi:hypothetical protein
MDRINLPASQSPFERDEQVPKKHVERGRSVERRQNIFRQQPIPSSQHHLFCSFGTLPVSVFREPHVLLWLVLREGKVLLLRLCPLRRLYVNELLMISPISSIISVCC